MKRPHEQLALLFELGRSFSELIELDELLDAVSARTRDVLDADSCAIFLLDEAKRELFVPVRSDLTPEVEKRLGEVRVPIDRSLAGWVVRTGKSALLPDAAKDERFYPEVDRYTGMQTKDLLYVPLRTRRGIVGAIGLRNRRSGPFDEDDLRFLETLSGPIAVAIDNARLYAEVKSSEERLRTEVGALRRDLARRDRFLEIVGTTEAMAEVFRLMEGAAASPITVLIEGETGTGKELVARGIHRESARHDGPFLAVNCAALPETLLDSELFGHRKGAFTGAIQDRRGLFEAASGGTIFLDEIGEMPLAMQAKLLRVLQESEVIPIGDTRPRPIDVRVISATNRDLAAEVRERRFREDLFYRLSAFPIRVPPLRERREDVPLLASRFLAAGAERHGKRIRGIEPDAFERLVAFDWPGNVRELENEIERAVALATDGEPIRIANLSPRIRTAAPQAGGEAIAAASSSAAAERTDKSLRRSRATFEARYIAEVLRQSGGNVSRAARELGMSRVSLHKKIKEYGLR